MRASGSIRARMRTISTRSSSVTYRCRPVPIFWNSTCACRTALIPIQNRGDARVWFDPRQDANDLHEIIVGDIPMPTGANLLELYLRVIPALPMQYEAYCLAF